MRDAISSLWTIPPSLSNLPTVLNGFYFSQGCFELIDHLTRFVEAANIELLLNHKVENYPSIDRKKGRWSKQKKGCLLHLN